jgi:hypothetical protein
MQILKHILDVYSSCYPPPTSPTSLSRLSSSPPFQYALPPHKLCIKAFSLRLHQICHIFSPPPITSLSNNDLLSSPPHPPLTHPLPHLLTSPPSPPTVLTPHFPHICHTPIHPEPLPLPPIPLSLPHPLTHQPSFPPISLSIGGFLSSSPIHLHANLLPPHPTFSSVPSVSSPTLPPIPHLLHPLPTNPLAPLCHTPSPPVNLLLPLITLPFQPPSPFSTGSSRSFRPHLKPTCYPGGDMTVPRQNPTPPSHPLADCGSPLTPI